MQTNRDAVRRVAVPAMLLLVAGVTAACGILPFSGRPASGYNYGSGAPLRVAVLDATGGGFWSPAIDRALRTYAGAAPLLDVQRSPAGGNIVVTVRDYDDADPPDLAGYIFPAGAGGFTTVYDVDGKACNYPPSPLPLNCSGEIATATIFLNDAMPPGPDIEARRDRLILHEFGHALGLTRHSPDLALDQLAARYGWPAAH